RSDLLQIPRIDLPKHAEITDIVIVIPGRSTGQVYLEQPAFSSAAVVASNRGTPCGPKSLTLLLDKSRKNLKDSGMKRKVCLALLALCGGLFLALAAETDKCTEKFNDCKVSCTNQRAQCMAR